MNEEEEEEEVRDRAESKSSRGCRFHGVDFNFGTKKQVSKNPK